MLLKYFQFNDQIKLDLKITRAFTLAEVLITLGIIGIISAITIPTLIIKYQKMVTLNKLKKTYSILSQALMQSESYNGSSASWITSSASQYFHIYWEPYLKTSTICTIPKCGYSSTTPWKYKNGQDYILDVSQPKLRPSFYLADGTFVMFRFYNTAKYNQNIFVDINGPQNPNTLGKDVFLFYVDQYKHRIIPGIWDNITKEEIINNCKEHGSTCSALIMYEGWRITDNYPW